MRRWSAPHLGGKESGRPGAGEAARARAAKVSLPHSPAKAPLTAVRKQGQRLCRHKNIQRPVPEDAAKRMELIRN